MGNAAATLIAHAVPLCSFPQEIKEGDVLLRVPLRMAFTDFPGDEESNELIYEVRAHGCMDVVHGHMWLQPEGNIINSLLQEGSNAP